VHFIGSRSDRAGLRYCFERLSLLAVRNIGLKLSLGALLGNVQIFAFFDLRDGSAIDRAMNCAALGLPFWATIDVILLSLLARQRPTMDS
jgi:hypothetical protein